ncbi:MAG TPA: ABC transporter substrate-binding protein [Candidatus Limnocylindrales bacterium]|nr:ABC transporter substrate-binding protein [Candidatus Limnocylindrales bacterium]
MNRIDRVVIAGLVLVLAIVAIAIGGPALAPKPAPEPTSAGPSSAAPEPYREGVLSRPTNVNPLAARTQADRDLVALVFEGLVARTADDKPTPALARSWTSTATGDAWTFELGPDRFWQDGEPVTADDVVFTIETLQDPDYHGPGSGSWAGITVSAVDAATVRFELATPIGGFLELATQPIVPRHLLGDTAPGAMADAAFGKEPIGSGPYTVAELDRDHAVLERAPDATTPPTGGGASPAPAGDPLATPVPTHRADDLQVGLARLEFRFFDDADSLATAFRNGELDVVSGLDPAAAEALAATPGARAIRNPSTTLAAVVLNLHPTEEAFADPRTRLALLEAVDRARLVGVVYGGAAVLADGLIPPSSWAFDTAASPPIGRDLKAAAKSLTAAGWTKAKDGWHHGGAKEARTIQLLVPNRTANPILFAAGSQIAADWTALGFTVSIVEEDPAIIATDHLRTGDFEAALVDIAIGHDPDLYALLASSQIRTGGANLIGLQDPLLDDLLEKARKPAADKARLAAYKALQERLAGGTYLLPMAWPNKVVVVAERVVGPAVREVADGSERFGDVLTWRLADDR